MEDFAKYSKIKTSEVASSESKPSVKEYVIIKIADNFLAIAVFILCVFFGMIGLFCLDAKDKNIDWALHASELSLGVFLGLLAKKGTK